MKPHKHAELIKAWADGAEIEFKSRPEMAWETYDCPSWYDYYEYRIKPEPKPDVVYLYLAKSDGWLYKKLETEWANLRLTFDSETGELKSAEVLK